MQRTTQSIHIFERCHVRMQVVSRGAHKMLASWCVLKRIMLNHKPVERPGGSFLYYIFICLMCVERSFILSRIQDGFSPE